MDKKTFRSWQRQRLADFAKTPAKKRQDQELTSLALQHPLVREAEKIGLTLPMPLEVDINGLIKELRGEGKELYLAKCHPGWQLDFLKWDEGAPLMQTKFGVWELVEEKEADNAYNKAVAVEKIKRRLLELQGDWKDDKEVKFFIQYDHYETMFIPDCWFIVQPDTTIPYMKSKEIARTIINEMEDELKLIFDIQ